jgi:hypothetical protein
LPKTYRIGSEEVHGGDDEEAQLLLMC